MIHELRPSDLRHCFFDDADGYMVSDWELATAWDECGRPTRWRRLRPEQPGDRRVLSHLLRSAARALPGEAPRG